MGIAIDPMARRDITLLRQKIAELEGRAAPIMLPQTERFAGIVEACAAEWGVTRQQLLGEGRTGDVLQARQAAVTLAHRLLGYSLPRIGRLVGRDHTTVLHAIRRMTRQCQDDPALAARLDEVAMRVARQKGTAA